MAAGDAMLREFTVDGIRERAWFKSSPTSERFLIGRFP
jgi:hypothetical protein